MLTLCPNLCPWHYDVLKQSVHFSKDKLTLSKAKTRHFLIKNGPESPRIKLLFVNICAESCGSIGYDNIANCLRAFVCFSINNSLTVTAIKDYTFVSVSNSFLPLGTHLNNIVAQQAN